MGQVLHGCATTTHAVRTAIQRSKAPLKELAARLRCFDRILLNGLIQPFQQPERVVGFFNTYRQLYPVSRQTLRGIAEQFQHWLKVGQRNTGETPERK